LEPSVVGVAGFVGGDVSGGVEATGNAIGGAAGGADSFEQAVNVKLNAHRATQYGTRTDVGIICPSGWSFADRM
jgi:hypothetical protein